MASNTAVKGPAPLDRSLAITRFPDRFARSKKELQLSLRSFAEMAGKTKRATKHDLPLVKLGRFGEARTKKKSFRSDANMLTIEGIEGDYDGGTVNIDEAAELLRKARLAGVLYTSPSNTPDDSRWRVMVPCSKALQPEHRERLCARLDAALGNILGPESFTRSQTFYVGEASDNPARQHRVMLVEDGRYIDKAQEIIGASQRPDADRPSGAELVAMAKDGPAELGDNEEDFHNALAEDDWHAVDSALKAIPAEAPYKDWFDVAMALHGGSGGSEEGFQRFYEWSCTSLDHNPGEGELREKWNTIGHYPGRFRAIGSLYYIAKTKYGWERPKKPKPKSKTVPGRRSLIPQSQCNPAPATDYVIKGMLRPGQVACIFGPPGAGKSVIAPFIGDQVAKGEAVFGKRTKPGKVLYIAAEDETGMAGRIAALREADGATDDLMLLSGVSDLFEDDDPKSDFSYVVSKVDERRPVLIFIDTLAMAFPSGGDRGDENSADYMGNVVRACRALARHGAAVMLIHHGTKAEGDTPRGHSVLNGALDMAMRVERGEEGVIRCTLTKNRSGTPDVDIAFRVGTHHFGKDDDGDPITAPVCEPYEPGTAPKAEKRSPSDRAAIKTLADMTARSEIKLEGQPAVSLKAWRAACEQEGVVSAADRPDSRRTAVDRVLKRLVSTDAIAVHGDLIALKPRGPQWSDNDLSDAFAEPDEPTPVPGASSAGRVNGSHFRGANDL